MTAARGPLVPLRTPTRPPARARLAPLVYEQSDLREAETLRDWRARTHASASPLLNRRRWWVGLFFGGVKS